MFKMLYLIGPDGLVNMSFENFQKMVWMTIVHLLHSQSWCFLEICITSKNKICRFCRFTHKHHLNWTLLFGVFWLIKWSPRFGARLGQTRGCSPRLPQPEGRRLGRPGATCFWNVGDLACLVQLPRAKKWPTKNLSMSNGFLQIIVQVDV